jgi:hypothetical protein
MIASAIPSPTAMELAPIRSSTITLQTGTERCLHVSGGSTAAGADIVQSACNGGANQRFRITP